MNIAALLYGWLPAIRDIQITVLFGRERVNFLPQLIIIAAFGISTAQLFFMLKRKTKAE